MANVAVASLFPVILHWLVTDLPWFYGPQYTHNLSGYGQSLLAALPFERNMLLADVFFYAVLFGGFELAKKKNPVLQSKKELAVS